MTCSKSAGWADPIHLHISPENGIYSDWFSVVSFPTKKMSPQKRVYRKERDFLHWDSFKVCRVAHFYTTYKSFAGNFAAVFFLSQ